MRSVGTISVNCAPKTCDPVRISSSRRITSCCRYKLCACTRSNWLLLNNAFAPVLLNAHPAGNPKIATFDLSSDVENEIKAGTLAFAVDQQQYLQGYLPIQFLYLFKKHEGQTVGGGTTVASGPLLVTKTNISNVSAAIAAGDD